LESSLGLIKAIFEIRWMPSHGQNELFKNAKHMYNLNFLVCLCVCGCVCFALL